MHGMNSHESPCKSGPVRVKVVTSGRYIKLDLIKLIQVIDDIDVQMGLQEGTAFIIPLTLNDKHKIITAQNVLRMLVSQRCFTPVHSYKFSFASVT